MIMIEQDYIMRLIKELIRAILKLLFHIDTTTIPVAEFVQDQETKQTLEELLKQIDSGMINEAENKLFDIIDGKDQEKLKAALVFYAYLNEKEEKFLLEHNFSHEEIKMGLKRIAAWYQLEEISNLFLE